MTSVERLGVIGVVRDPEARVLLVQRSALVTHPGLWCFPGGHVEPGESLEDAVVRELQEELAIEARAERHLGFVRVPGAGYRLEVLAVEWIGGEIRPNPLEIAAARFLSLAEGRELGSPMPSNSWVMDLLEGRGAG